MNIYFYLLLIICFYTTISKQVYMATVFRHGARYPVNDIYDGKQTKPFHGLLTEIGLREQYLLGSYIQDDYMNNYQLLNKTLHQRQVQFFTLFDAERCVQSAYAHALGLFSFYKGQEIDPNMDKKLLEPPFQTIYPNNLKQQSPQSNFALQNGFQPVPIRNADPFFPICKNYYIIFGKRAIASAKIIAQLQVQYTLLTQQMSILFNLTISQSNIQGMTYLYDTIYCDKFLGRPLPKKFTDIEYQKLRFIQRYLFVLNYEQQPARIFSAPFVNTMIENMENLVKGDLGVKKLSAYSVHDSQIIPLLVYFNLTSSDCLKKQFANHTVHGNCAVPVPFASNMLFELHQDDNNSLNYFVKIRYNGEYFNLCEKDKTECEFKEFAQRSKAHLMDFHKQCGTLKNQQQILIQQQ